MAFYSLIFSANYKRFFDNLSKIAKEEKKNVLLMALDTGWCVFRYGLGLSDYLNFKIYKRTAAQRKEYVGVRTQNKLYETVSPSAYKRRYSFKPVFHEDFADLTRREYIVPSEENRQECLDFFHRHPIFIAKPYDGLGGHGVEKIHTKDIPDVDAFIDRCIQQRLFWDQLVIQHPEMNVLCPASINTLRIMTFHDREKGTSEVVWIGLRVGNGINYVDNFHSQGMGVLIDVDTGKLVGPAIDKDNIPYTHHPATGVAFDGFQIPCYQEAKQMALDAALRDDKILMVGWDVAISENGPLLIEGNRRAGFDMPQVLDDRGRMDIVRSVMSRAKGGA